MHMLWGPQTPAQIIPRGCGMSWETSLPKAEQMGCLVECHSVFVCAYSAS